MITRCSICRSRNLKRTDEVLVCLSCENIFSQYPKEEALSRVSSKLKKQEERRIRDEKMQQIQSANTKRPYLRFQFRIF